MDPENTSDPNYMAKLILSYLLDHLDAQDSLEGVVQWWLTRQHIVFQVNRVKKALARLVREDLIIKVGPGDQREHYRINPAKVTDIKAWLARN